MMKTFIIIFIALNLCSCESIRDKEQEKSDANKAIAIDKFESEFKAQCDSSGYYFDLGLSQLDEGYSPKEVLINIDFKVKQLGENLADMSEDFKYTANEIKLTREEWDNLFKRLQKDYVDPNTVKYELLISKGVDF